MGQKVHPRSLRLGIIQGWQSTWIADSKTYARNLAEDEKIRIFLKAKLKGAAISRIEIDRKAQRVIVRIITGRPGMVVGRGGQGLDQLRTQIQNITSRKDIQIDVLEVNRVEADANLVAESIAQQLEKRIAYRRAMKQSMQRSMRAGIKGIKIMVSGRLGGAEIARTEWAKEGRIPLHTFRADIEYGFAEALTVFGIIGVKVWIFKEEVMPGDIPTSNIKSKHRNDDAGNSGGPGGLHGSGRRGRGANAPSAPSRQRPGRARRDEPSRQSDDNSNATEEV